MDTRNRVTHARTRYGRRLLGRSGLAVALFAAAVGTALSRGAERPASTGLAPAPASRITGFTAPFQTVTLAAVRTGRLAERCVPEGSPVSAGERVIRIDAEVQARRVELSEAEAASTIEIELAEVRLAVARTDLERLQGAREAAAATANELRSAEAAVRAAELELAKAKFQHEQAGRALALERAILDEFTIKAPFSGVVTEHLRQVGDTIEDRESIAQVVQLDPLVISVDCPIELAPVVQTDTMATVTCGEGFGPPRDARVVFVNPVADAASQTFRVKLHVPNSDGRWLAGMRVGVAFQAASDPAPAGDAPTPASARR
jgi:RND family efflux transporter MFP subunit